MKCYNSPELQTPNPIYPSVKFVLGLDEGGNAGTLDSPDPVENSYLYYDQATGDISWKKIDDLFIPAPVDPSLADGLMFSADGVVSYYDTPGVFYITGAGAAASVAAGTNGQILTLVGGLPVWQTLDPILVNAPSFATGISGKSTSSVMVSYNIKRLSIYKFDGTASHFVNLTGLTADTTIQGAGGVDLLPKTNDAWYYVYVITGTAGEAITLSLNAAFPSLPTGYTSSLLIGVARIDASGNLNPYVQQDKKFATATIGISGPTTLPNTTPADITGTTQWNRAVPPIGSTVDVTVNYTNSGAVATATLLSEYISGLNAIGQRTTEVPATTGNVTRSFSTIPLATKGAPVLKWITNSGTSAVQGTLYVDGYTIE